GLDIGSYDAVLSSLTPNVINRQWYAFSDPFYLVGPVLIVPEKSKAQSLEDMEGKIIGIESGALQVFNIPEPPNIVIIPYGTASQALENLDNNVIDGVILEALRAYIYIEGFYKGRLKIASLPLTDKGLRLITRNEPRSILLVSRFNEGLKAIREEGLYGELIEKWGLIKTD
ncbi:MAG: substrate-binding periplasmic protein, partial [Waddliaceae bacterium]